MTRFLGWKEFKDKVKSETPTVLYDRGTVTAFPFSSIPTAATSASVSLSQDCRKFKKILVEGVVATKLASGVTSASDTFVTTELLDPVNGRDIPLQDWFLASDSDSNKYTYCFRGLYQIADNGMTITPYLYNGTENRNSGWKRFSVSSTSALPSSFTSNHPIVITKVIGFNNLK